MIRFIYIILISLLFCSCASQKKKEKHLAVSAVMTVDKENNRQIWQSLSERDLDLLLQLENMEVNIRRYDTSAIPDSMGNYPLMEDERRVSIKSTNLSSEKYIEIEKKQNENLNLITTGNIEIKQSECTDDSIKTYSLFNLNWLWLLIIPAVGFYFFYKFRLKR